MKCQRWPPFLTCHRSLKVLLRAPSYTVPNVLRVEETMHAAVLKVRARRVCLPYTLRVFILSCLLLHSHKTSWGAVGGERKKNKDFLHGVAQLLVWSRGGELDARLLHRSWACVRERFEGGDVKEV